MIQTTTSCSPLSERDALYVARLLLLAVYQETTPSAATLRHSAVVLVDSCRHAPAAGRRAEEGLARLERELELAQHDGSIDGAAAARLRGLVLQAAEVRGRCRTARAGR